MSTFQLIDFAITEKLNQKFLSEIEKFDIRTKNILMRNEMMSLEKFRSYILGEAEINDYHNLRGIGTKTKKRFVNLFRKTLKRNMYYGKGLKKYNTDFEKLPAHAKNLLRRKGIGLFERFYYYYFVKKTPIVFDDHYIHFTRPQAKRFISAQCKSINNTLKFKNQYTNIKTKQ